MTVCRIRPFLARELKGQSASSPRRCVTVGRGAGRVNFIDHSTVYSSATPTRNRQSSSEEGLGLNFDVVAGETMTQQAVYDLVGRPITRSCLEGYNGTILCYGQTSSGKSFTMFGSQLGTEDCTDSKGLIPRALEDLWSCLGESVSFRCRCSFYEIYQEKVFDLLTESDTFPNGLSVREDAAGGVYVENCSELEAESVRQAEDILLRGYRNRSVGETAMNRESSRSHAVFQMQIELAESKNYGAVIKRAAKFTLVDLAGSERQKDTLAVSGRLKEAVMINKSLSTLGRVINSLVEVCLNC